jgi:hypothetical protein
VVSLCAGGDGGEDVGWHCDCCWCLVL